LNIETHEGPTGQDLTALAARSLVYGAFGESLDYPDEELLELIRGGVLANRFQELLREIDPSLLEGVRWEALCDAGAADDLQIEYTRLFDVGASGPPCPLYGGLYHGARMKTMEEVVRFYNHFGLSMAEKPHELPDHLTTQLEFLHFLTFQEAEILKEGEDPASYRRAQRDFIARHPGRWIPKLLAKLESKEPMSYFLESFRLLDAFLKSELERLIGLVGKVPLAAEGKLPVVNH